MEQISLKRLFLAVIGLQSWWVIQSFAKSMWWTDESVRHESHDMSQLHHIHIT